MSFDHNFLKLLVKTAGSVLLSILIISIPFICGLSFTFKELTFVKLLLIMMTIGYVIVLAILIYVESEKE